MLATRCYGLVEKPTLLLLHGFLGDKDDWQALMPRLSQRFYCICMDLPGHGDSPALPLPSPGFEQVAQQIQSSLSDLGVERFHLLGYSLGGRIALHLLPLMGEAILSITLESCHPGLASDALRRERLTQDNQWNERLQQVSIEAFLDLWYQQGVFADLSDKQRQQLIARRRYNKIQGLSAIYLPTSLGQQQELIHLPNQYPIAWHYLVGKDDTKFSALAAKWQTQAPIQLHYFDNAGHNVHLAQGEAFCHTLEAILLKDPL
ncbi:2-succinyl-6-hydroxy-2,4-cyclohexadiene-1-carboxylate synthase [Shewanella sp. AS1]|uniref:2-succinyl-6-hydroxy-2, 4-cyclohexadiene-1-carboxylate synthase n=1 Tax=Shewanella sp. AS1 TaxID=2907626 RepID=UPI001F1F5590|nr:2-succinyl-6-hydroxy-2,4-cyclohexadiene-1-carboxylate synthase [Shewanella sp. AS1]MCE9680125.1 2-succinyl-6-hydroxy-2,4-cyclohexadiene-1-carboxylate synthase [Shewanella sp. AS1]